MSNKSFPQSVHCLHNNIWNQIVWQWRWKLWNHSKNCESIANIENCETNKFLKRNTNMALRQWSSEIYTAEFRELQASTFCCSRDGRLGLLAGNPVLFVYFYQKPFQLLPPKWVVIPSPPAFVLISSLRPNLIVLLWNTFNAFMN